MSRRPHSPPPDAAARRELERHVVEVQRTIRTCEGCGLCCTAAYNSVQILGVEAARIAAHLATLPERVARGLRSRIERAIAEFQLEGARGKPTYTCPFLEADRSCALPLNVKPVACLAFNPLTPDACDMEADRFHRAHDPVERANTAAGFRATKLPIPVAVRAALDGSRRRSKRNRGTPLDPR